MKVTCREILAGDGKGIDAVAGLHTELLSFGPMAELGFNFIRDVGYKVHLQDGLLHAVLCEVDGRPAGFIAFTPRSITFHRHSVGDHWLYAGWVICKSIFRNPRRLPGLQRAVRMVSSRRREVQHGQDPLGEVISLAVRPEYLTRQFIQRSGIWISERLVNNAIAFFRRAGISRMRMLVDEGNRAPLLVYHRMGARFESYEHGGEPNMQVWFDLDRLPVETSDTSPGRQIATD